MTENKTYRIVASVLFAVCVFLIYVSTAAMEWGKGIKVALAAGAIITTAFFFSTKKSFRTVGNGLFAGSMASFLLILFDSVMRTAKEMRYGLPFSFNLNEFGTLPLLMFIAASFMCIILFRVFEKKSKNDDFVTCFRILTILTAVFTTLFYIVFFVIARFNVHQDHMNFIPFATMKEYLSWYRVGNWIEPLIQFAGNIMFFFVLGFYAPIVFPKAKKMLFVVFPMILSGIIELSQLILKNGSCDIDDFLLNVFGFMLGWAVMTGCDLLSMIIKDSDEHMFKLFN